MIEIENTSTHSLTFPPLPTRLVERENLTSQIMTVLDRSSMAFVYGEQGIGKTVLLAQFTQENPKSGISVFLKPNSIGITNLSTIRREIYTQSRYILNNRILDVHGDPSEEVYHSTLAHLARRAKQSLGRIYFIIDGFGEQTVDYQAVILRSVLPLGMAPGEFKYVLSGLSIPHSLNQIKADYEAINVYGFSDFECHHLLEDLKIEDSVRTDLIRAVRGGHPGRLAIIRRELKQGADPTEMVSRARAEYQEMIGLEWSRAIVAHPNSKRLLAALAYARADYTPEELAIVTEFCVSDVNQMLSAIPFIVEAKQGWRLATPLHQEYAQNQIQDLQYQVLDGLAKLTLNPKAGAPNYAVAVEYMAESARHDDILSLVTPEVLAAVVDRNQDFTIAEQLSQRAVEAARALGHLGSEFRMNLLSSTAHTLRDTQARATSIKTMANLGKFDEAYELAASCPILTERFMLLAHVGRRQKEEIGATRADIVSGIDLLIEVVVSSLSESARVSAGIDLFVFHPRAAVLLAKLSAQLAKNGESPDRFLATIAIAASLVRGKQRDVEAFDTLLAEVESESSKSFLSAIAQASAAKSLLTVLDETGMWEDESALPFLEKIGPAIARRGADEAVQVLDRISSSVISASSLRLPRIRALSTVLSAARRSASAAELMPALGRIDTIAEAETTRPTLDAITIRLELIAVRALSLPGSELVAELEKVADVCASIEDIALRLEGYATLYSIVCEFESKVKIADASLEGRIQQQVLALAEIVVKTTAIHELSLERPLRIIARSNLPLALKLSDTANTVRRKGLLRKISIVEHLESIHSLRNNIDVALEQIENTPLDSHRERLVQAVLSFIGEMPSTKRCHAVGALDWIYKQIKSLSSPQTRTSLLVELLHLIPVGNNVTSELMPAPPSANALHKNITVTIFENLRFIDAPWKILSLIGEIGRFIDIYSEQLNVLDSVMAETIDHANISSSDINQEYKMALQLAIIAVAGATSMGLASPYDLQRLEAAVKRLPQAIDQIAALEQLIVRLWKFGSHKELRDVAERLLIPTLEELPSDTALGLKSEALIVAAPSLFIYDYSVFQAELEMLSPADKQAAWLRTSETLMRKQSVADPFSDQSFAVSFNYKDALQLLDALEQCNLDGQIVRGVGVLHRSIERFNTSMSRIQKAGVLKRAREVIEKKLPSPDGILHEGYKIWAEALILKSEKNGLKGSDLDGLAKRARNIPNVSDKCFVLTVLGELASRIDDKRKQLAEAEKLAAHIEAGHERLERLCHIAETYAAFDPPSAKRVLLQTWPAMNTTTNPWRDVLSTQQRAIDLAYSISPEFAQELSIVLDDDSARQARRLVDRRAEFLANRNQILGSGKNLSLSQPSIGKTDGEAVWEALGAINAGRALPLQPQDVLDKTQGLLEKGLRAGFPASALFVECATSARGKKEYRETLMRDVVDATLDGVEFLFTSFRKIRGVGEIKTDRHFEGGDVGAVFGNGDRSAAMKYLRDWLEANATERIVFADGYFGVNEVDFLSLCLEACPRVPVYIITGLIGAEKGLDGMTVDEALELAWKRISDQPAPQCTVHVVGLRPSKKSPLHDRFLFGDTAAIALGTSFSGFGSRVAAITPVDSKSQVDLLSRYIEPILRGEVKIDGHRVTSSKFELGS